MLHTISLLRSNHVVLRSVYMCQLLGNSTHIISDEHNVIALNYYILNHTVHFYDATFPADSNKPTWISTVSFPKAEQDLPGAKSIRV